MKVVVSELRPGEAYDIFLDGELVTQVIEASEEDGFVRHFELDALGNIVTVRRRGVPQASIITRYGEVQIRQKS